MFIQSPLTIRNIPATSSAAHIALHDTHCGESKEA